MTQQISAHLSEEAFDDLLIGLGSAESEAHLGLCDACRRQFDEFHSNLKTFNQASLAWIESTVDASSEARSALPLRVADIQSSHRDTLASRLFSPRLFSPRLSSPFGWAVAAALLLVLGLQIWNREHQPSLTDNAAKNHPAQIPMQSDSEAQIAQDNQLLQSVNLALNSSEASPLQDYGLENELRPHAQSRTQQRPKARHR